MLNFEVTNLKFFIGPTLVNNAKIKILKLNKSELCNLFFIFILFEVGSQTFKLSRS